MNPKWDLSEVLDEEQDVDTNPVEFDVPASRSYDWEKRATEIKERDNYVCQRCGNHNGNYENYPLTMEAHHLVPGKYLSKPDARVELNLIAVCESCHGYLEGSHIEWQLNEIGRDDALQILSVLKERSLSPYLLSQKLETSEDCVRSLVSQLERMNCVTAQGGGRYRTVCPATAKSTADRVRLRWKQEQAVRRSLEETLSEFRQTLTTGLDELESTLEAGDRDQVEATLERLQNTIRTTNFEEDITLNDR
ncbi:HNH endonuclease [Natrinema versiforme]|uniref:HNH endonuclease n=1 Tax=Natrinema versiforme JCM 10478 TaxID=1227496 RepID=L9XS98_9EURY|nr:HNH endonuclease [Natrinema versiforme]ELY63488.1 HNH endonuclease [Natrinema versiforme JCM 10478]